MLPDWLISQRSSKFVSQQSLEQRNEKIERIRKEPKLNYSIKEKGWSELSSLLIELVLGFKIFGENALQDLKAIRDLVEQHPKDLSELILESRLFHILVYYFNRRSKDVFLSKELQIVTLEFFIHFFKNPQNRTNFLKIELAEKFQNYHSKPHKTYNELTVS